MPISECSAADPERYHADILLVFFIVCKHLGELFGQKMAVNCLCRSLEDLDIMINPVDENDDILSDFPCSSSGIKTGEFQEGTEESADVAVHDGVSLR